MLSLNDISAWIEVDGKELEQYGIEEDVGRSQVTCWIPTQAGKCFSVVFRDDAAHRDHTLRSSLHLDGSSVKGKILLPPTMVGHPPNLVIDRPRMKVQEGQALSVSSSRPFMFSKLEPTDEDEYLNQASLHLGEIRVDIKRVQLLGLSLFRSPSSGPGHGKVHERSKKAVTHCVSYGQEVKTRTRRTHSVRPLDGNTPLATFIFKYRDFGLLQANGIIPKPPPAKKKAAVSEDVLDLTTDDDVKPEPIDEEIENVDNATQKGKRTAGPQSKRSNSGCKSEPQPAKRIKREKTFVSSGEVIDLT